MGTPVLNYLNSLPDANPSSGAQQKSAFSQPASGDITPPSPQPNADPISSYFSSIPNAGATSTSQLSSLPSPSTPSDRFTQEDPNDNWLQKSEHFLTTPLTETLLGWGEYREGAPGWERGLEKVASGLTSPLSVLMMAAFAPAGVLESAAGSVLKDGLVEGGSVLGEEALPAAEAAAKVEGYANAVNAAKKAQIAGSNIQQAVEQSGFDYGQFQNFGKYLRDAGLKEDNVLSEGFARRAASTGLRAAGVTPAKAQAIATGAEALVNLGFSVNQVHGAIYALPRLADLLEEGKYDDAAEYAIEGGAGGVFGALGAAHGLKGLSDLVPGINERGNLPLADTSEILKNIAGYADAQRDLSINRNSARSRAHTAELYENAGLEVPARLKETGTIGEDISSALGEIFTSKADKQKLQDTEKKFYFALSTGGDRISAFQRAQALAHAFGQSTLDFFNEQMQGYAPPERGLSDIVREERVGNTQEALVLKANIKDTEVGLNQTKSDIETLQQALKVTQDPQQVSALQEALNNHQASLKALTDKYNGFKQDAAHLESWKKPTQATYFRHYQELLGKVKEAQDSAKNLDEFNEKVRALGNYPQDVKILEEKFPQFKAEGDKILPDRDSIFRNIADAVSPNAGKIADSPSVPFKPWETGAQHPSLPANLNELIQKAQSKTWKPEQIDYAKSVIQALSSVAKGLNDKEQAFLEKLQEAEGDNWGAGYNNDLIHSIVENHIRRIWEPKTNVGNQAIQEAKSGSFSTNVLQARRRVYNTDIEGILQGRQLATHDPVEISRLDADNIARAAANRKFIDSAMNDPRFVDSRGLPLFVARGSGNLVPAEDGVSSSILVNHNKVRNIVIPEDKVKELTNSNLLEPFLSQGIIVDKTPQVNTSNVREWIAATAKKMTDLENKNPLFFDQKTHQAAWPEVKGFVQEHATKVADTFDGVLNNRILAENLARELRDQIRNGVSPANLQSQIAEFLMKESRGRLANNQEYVSFLTPEEQAELGKLREQHEPLAASLVQALQKDVQLTKDGNLPKVYGMNNLRQLAGAVLSQDKTGLINQAAESSFAGDVKGAPYLRKMLEDYGISDKQVKDIRAFIQRNRQYAEGSSSYGDKEGEFPEIKPSEISRFLITEKEFIKDKYAHLLPYLDREYKSMNRTTTQQPDMFEEQQLGEWQPKGMSNTLRAVQAAADDKVYPQLKQDLANLKQVDKLYTSVNPLTAKANEPEAMKLLEDINSRQPKQYLWTPKDHITVNHPSFQNWNWMASAPDGTSVLAQGDVAVSREFYRYVRNRLGLEPSSLRQDEGIGKFTKPVLQAGAKLKSALLSFSPFHLLQETLRGMMIGVNPWFRPNPMADLNTPFETVRGEKPVLRLGVENGATLVQDKKMAQEASEGLASHVDFGKGTPVIGHLVNLQNTFHSFLFDRYIPALKAKALRVMFDKYASAHPDWSDDAVAGKAAEHVNNAFGGQNWREMGRSATTQDWFHILALAPDWLESEMRFTSGLLHGVGLGAGRYEPDEGKNFSRQQVATMAASMWGIARVLNLLTSGDAHYENPFGLVTKDKDGREIVFSMRTVPTDILHAATDPMGFLTGRTSPVLRTAREFITGRNEYDQKLTDAQKYVDLISNLVPIPAQQFLKNVTGLGTSSDVPQMAQLAKAGGATANVYRSEAEKQAANIASERSEEGAMTPVLINKHRMMLKLEDDLRSGRITSQNLRDMVDFGTLPEATAKQVVANAKATVGEDPETARMYSRVSRMTMQDALSVYDAANPRERQILDKVLLKKAQAYTKKARTSLTPDERANDPVFRRARQIEQISEQTTE